MLNFCPDTRAFDSSSRANQTLMSALTSAFTPIKLARYLGALALLLLLGACASRTLIPTPEAGARWRAQQAQVGSIDHWQLDGRIALKNARDGFNAGVSWLEQPPRYRFELVATLGATAARLNGEAGLAVLELPDQPPLTGRDARDLLVSHFGWDIPVDDLRWWVRGLPAPGGRAAEVDAQGLPVRLQSGSWQVHYLSWTEVQRDDDSAMLVMPQRIEARSGDLTLKLSIHGWRL